uniref:Uncharacterized protein n=1 Tax=Leersia perrieri TaxID=77586 RepID=A0A0D9WDX0_9ORYZ
MLLPIPSHRTLHPQPPTMPPPPFHSTTLLSCPLHSFPLPGSVHRICRRRFSRALDGQIGPPSPPAMPTSASAIATGSGGIGGCLGAASAARTVATSACGTRRRPGAGKRGARAHNGDEYTAHGDDDDDLDHVQLAAASLLLPPRLFKPMDTPVVAASGF